MSSYGNPSVRLRLIGAVVLIVAASSAIGVVALFVLAALSRQPAIFLAGGGAVFILTTVTGIRLLTARRKLSTQDRRAAWLSTALLSLTTMIVFSATTLIPSGEHGHPVHEVAGQQHWQMPSGSLLRVTEIEARAAERPTPVIFVHGGPGTPDMLGDSEYFGQLADAGFDVYVYDGVGSGDSSRLPDPTEYSIERDVADLEGIRDRIGAQNVVLIGHSYGATVVAQYLAAYPDHVSRAIFSSPGSLDPADHSGGELTSRLDNGQRLTLYSRLLQPRNLLVYGLLQVNPVAAHAVAGDTEMDAENDAIYAITEPALHCDGMSTEPAHLPTGLGFYRLQYPQSASAPVTNDIRPALHDMDTPALVIKGACDYLSWASALTYADSLPSTTLAYLHAGHNAYQDAPDEYLAAVLAFLNGEPIPSEISPIRSPPSDYQGPMTGG